MEKLPSRAFWLISKIEAGRMYVLTTNLAGRGPSLPLFSVAEEAAMYLELGPEQGRWRVRETATGELVSVLFGPCAGVGRVLLDPLPDLDGRVLSEIVAVESGEFVEYLLGSARRRPRVPHEKRCLGRARYYARSGRVNAWHDGLLSPGAG